QTVAALGVVTDGARRRRPGRLVVAQPRSRRGGCSGGLLRAPRRGPTLLGEPLRHALRGSELPHGDEVHGDGFVGAHAVPRRAVVGLGACGRRSVNPDILVPQLRFRGDELLHHLYALRVVEVDDVHALPAQPVGSALERTRLADHHGADAELFDDPAAVPAGLERCDHDSFVVTSFAAGIAVGIGLAVAAGVAVLHAAVVAATQQRAVVTEERGADGDAAFS